MTLLWARATHVPLHRGDNRDRLVALTSQKEPGHGPHHPRTAPPATLYSPFWELLLFRSYSGAARDASAP
jgi:hypothetical protein